MASLELRSGGDLNPFEPPNARPKQPDEQRRPVSPAKSRPLPDVVDRIMAATLLLLIPTMVGIAHGLTLQYLDEQHGFDERYLSLSMGIPSALAAVALAYCYWARGQRALPIAGSLLWCALAVIGVLATLAMWSG